MRAKLVSAAACLSFCALAAGAGSEPLRKVYRVHLEAGLAAKVQTARSRLDAVRRKLHGKDALLAELPDLEYRVALFDLGAAGDVDPTRTDFAAELKDVSASLDMLEAGRSALAARRGDFRRAYRSARRR